MAVLNRFNRQVHRIQSRPPAEPGSDEYELLADYLTQLCDLPSTVKQMTDWEADFVDRQWKQVFDERKTILGKDVNHIYRMARDFGIADVDPS